MITRNENPCWEAVCDKCGDGDNYDFGNSFHYASEAELIENLHSVDWMIVRADDGSVRALYCNTCWDEMSEQEKGEAQG